MPYTANPDLAALLRVLPKTETHLHLEGALPWELCARLRPDSGLKPPPSWADDYRFNTFEEFLALLFEFYQDWHKSPERYAESARRVFRGHLVENVRYVECSIDAWTSWNQGLDLREVAQAVMEAVPDELIVRLFVGFHRDGHSEEVVKTAWDCLDWPEVSGVDIHDVEIRPFADWLIDFYAAAGEKGKCRKAHAGEFGDGSYVKKALELLEVERIEHGIRVVEDEAILSMVKERGVTFDICPISNVELRASGEMKTHPIRKLFDAGVRCTISTDDPLIFGNHLSEEYVALSEALNFSMRELIQIARNGWEAALLDEETRRTYLKQLEELESVLEREEQAHS